MEKNSGGPTSTTAPTTKQRREIQLRPMIVRPRIVLPRLPSLAPLTSGPRPEEVDNLAGRYNREAQLAIEGLLYLGVRLPFRLMALLVEAGRQWEEEYYHPSPPRRVPLHEEEK